MLNSLEIRNYRNLKHLRIEKLGRVNLVIGKNNTGKSSLLEAVFFFAKKGALESFYQILSQRNEDLNSEYRMDQVDANVKSLSSLFSNYSAQSNEVVEISVNNHVEEYLNFRLEKIKAYDDLQRKNIETNEFMLVIDFSNHRSYTALLRDPISSLKYFPPRESPDSDSVELVRSFHGLGFSSNIQYPLLYESIALTEKEVTVVEALKIIDSQIDAIAFRTDLKSNQRFPVVRNRTTQRITTLRSMGDGVNRILTIIVAMVNCENGFLLIDEFENGLHYSVQEKLWEVIFELAEQLNIQVFATTHSNDTIQAFTKIANEKQSDGYLIKLRNINGEIDAVVFNEEELQTAAEAEYLDLRL